MSTTSTTSPGGIVGALLLALVSAAAINLGFLLQHRGLSATRSLSGGRRVLLQATLRNRSWLGGQALGWVGFAAQIVAVSIAPLSLVQSFAAGGLALSVPLAAGLFGYRISRRERLAVLLVAAGLAVLPIGLSTAGDRLQAGRLAVSVGLALAAAIPMGLSRAAPLRAIAAGLFYGVADAAIKAVSVGLGAHGATALLSGWTALALLSTFAGFLAFQAALRAGSAITGISLMNCLAALVALGCGLLAFGESLGRTPAAAGAHFLAVALVLACVPVLSGAQTEIADTLEPGEPDGAHATDPASNLLVLWHPARERATDGEQRCLQPRPQAGMTRPQHVAQPQVARQRERSL